MRGLRVFRRIVRYYRDHLPATVAGAVCVIASAVVALQAPGVVRRAIDALAADAPLATIWIYAATLVGIALASGALLFAQRSLLVGVSRHLEHRLRVDLYAHLLRLPASFYMKERVGDLLTRATSDVGTVRMAVGPALMYAINTVSVAILAIFFMIRIDLTLTLLALAVLPPVAVATRYFGHRIHLRWRQAQEALSQYTARLQEHLVGLRVLRAFACEATEQAVLGRHNRAYVAASSRVITLTASFQPVLHALIGISFVIVLAVGGGAVMGGRISLGQFVEFNLYLVRMIWPMIAVGWVANLLQRGMASMKRIEELFAQEMQVEGDSSPGAQRHRPTKPAALDIRNVSFAFPRAREAAVSGVSLRLHPGQRAAIVGGVGSGKSTLLSLVPRIVEPPAGTVFLDDTDVHALPLERLRSEVALVPQGSFLFSATLQENISLARPDASLDQVREAALAAGLGDDLEQFPDGLDTVVGERGVTLSGGQRQRVAIARALITEPRLLLLDDCLSAVDTQTERTILASLPHTTLLFATHRMAAAEMCDLVLVLAQGSVIEAGSPAELAQRDGVYAHLLSLQRLEVAPAEMTA